MASDEEDLAWLYRREPQAPGEPEPTRVMTPEQLRALEAQGRPQQPADAYPPPSSQQPPPGYGPVPNQQPPRGYEQAPNQQPPGGYGPPAAPTTPKPRRRFRPLRWLLALLVAWVIFLVGMPIFAWSQTTKVDATPSGTRPDGQPGTAILLVGSDSREGLTDEEQSDLGTGSTAGQRTDTMMILYVAPNGDSALISLPRDSYLPIPGNGSNKLNAAYSLGGPKLLMATVEQNTGLRMDGYVEVGFGGFVEVVDALGGIEMCLEEAIQDTDSKTDLEAGCQTLDGAEALGYVRMRKADPRGDIGRAERQREMLEAIAKKAMSPSTFINPVKYASLNLAAASTLTRGEDTGIVDMGMTAVGLVRSAGDSGTTMVVPLSSTSATTSAGSSVLWDESQASALFEQLARGDASDLDKYVS